MTEATLLCYTHAMMDASDSDTALFWGWLERRKDDTYVGQAGTDDACPLHMYLQLSFFYDEVKFEVTATDVLVYEQKWEEDTPATLLTIVPLPPVARLFIRFLDRGTPVAPVVWTGRATQADGLSTRWRRSTYCAWHTGKISPTRR